MLVAVIIIICIVVLLCLGIRVVPQQYVKIVERLGKYHSTWDAGIHYKLPLIDRIAKTVSMKEQVYDFPPQPVITKDNVTMKIDSVVFIKVFDPKLFAYGIEKPIQGIENLAATNLRSVVGEMELDQTLSGREVINGKMQVALDEATDPWGIKVIRVEIKNIQPPEEIEAVMTKQMRAERERRETILQAEAHQESIVKRAEGDKRAKVLAAEAERDAQIAIAEGKARSVELVYEAESKGLEMLKDANVSETVLKLKGIDALKVIADGRATKIFMPNNLSDMISSLGIVAESMGVGDHTPIDKSPKPKEKKPADPCLDEESNEITKNAAVVTDAMESDVETTYQNMTL